MKYFLLACLFLSAQAVCASKKVAQSYKYKSFEEAKGSQDQLKFIVESTKVGIFSSDVDGYALEFSIQAMLIDNKLTDMNIEISSNSLNTDNSDRDEKLHEYCLSVKKFPSIKIQIDSAYDLSKGKKENLVSTVLIRGKKKQVNIQFEASSNEDFIMVNAESLWALSKMEIPDPSIAIAKLSDQIRIKAKLQIPISR